MSVTIETQRNLIVQTPIGSQRLHYAVHIAPQPQGSKAPSMLIPFLLDTGSELTVLDASTALLHGLAPFNKAGKVPLNTRLGQFQGHIIKCRFTIKGLGGSVSWDGEAWVCDTWTGPNILGMKGGLEHLKTCLDPRNGLASFALSR